MPKFPSSARLFLVAASILVGCSIHAFCQADLFDYVPNLPYTAEFLTTFSQADGTLVHQGEWTGNKTIQSRDSVGRTWIQDFQLFGSQTGRYPISTFLYIPSRRQAIQLIGKTATVHTFPGTGPIPRKWPPPSGVTMEKLPGKMINGIYAEGTRITWVRPQADKSGTHYMDVEETWISPDLKINVLSKFTSTYPGSSQTISEIVRLDRNEPDAALFEIPADYKIAEAR